MPTHRFPPVVYYVLLIAWIVGVVVIAFAAGVQTAGFALAGSLVLLAVGRVAFPAGTVPQVRSAATDAITLLVLAGALAYLSTWGDTPA